MRKSRKTGENLRIHRFFDLQNEFSLCWRSKSNIYAPGLRAPPRFWFATSAENEDFLFWLIIITIVIIVIILFYWQLIALGSSLWNFDWLSQQKIKMFCFVIDRLGVDFSCSYGKYAWVAISTNSALLILNIAMCRCVWRQWENLWWNWK